SYRILHGCYDVLPNSVLSDQLYENLKTVALPNYDVEELEFARKLASTLSEDQKRNTLIGLGLDPAAADQLLSRPVHGGVGYWGRGWTIPASTDVGDVSHLTPTAQINTATYPIGIGSHTWQATAASGSSIGMKGMLFAAKVLAGTVFDLLSNPTILENAKAEFRKATGTETYTAALDLLQNLE
ncbi:MAG: hypothetical protein SNJ78_07380, partial [Spirochaetales bacterium]